MQIGSAATRISGSILAAIRQFAVYSVALLAANFGYVFLSKGPAVLLEQFWSRAVPVIAGSLLVVVIHRMTAHANLASSPHHRPGSDPFTGM